MIDIEEYKRRVRELRAWHKGLPVADLTLGAIIDELLTRWPDTGEEDAMMMATMSCAPDDVIGTISFDDAGVSFDPRKGGQ